MCFNEVTSLSAPFMRAALKAFVLFVSVSTESVLSVKIRMIVILVLYKHVTLYMCVQCVCYFTGIFVSKILQKDSLRLHLIKIQ